MRRSITTLAVALGAVALTPANAADGGKFGGALKKMMTSAAAGQCSADMMGDTLLGTCQKKLSVLQPAFADAGPIKTMTLVTATGTDANRVETYMVTFENGQATWLIGHPNNGKFDMVAPAN